MNVIDKYDLVGQSFGNLTVLKLDNQPKSGWKRHHRWWVCLCDCGKTTEVPTYKLLAGLSKSCGCRIRNSLKSKRFGKLIAIERILDPKTDILKWRCRCDCGEERLVHTNQLSSGEAHDCGHRCLLRLITSLK